MSVETENLNELNPDTPLPPESPPEPKPDHSEKYAKTKELNPEVHREIHEMLLKGYTATEISPIINRKYDIDRHTGYRWIKTVLQRIGEAVGRDKKKLDINVGLAVERHLTLYQRALEKDEFAVAFRCLQEVSKLQGLRIEEEKPKEPKKKKQESSKVDVSGMSLEELKRMAEGTSILNNTGE